MSFILYFGSQSTSILQRLVEESAIISKIDVYKAWLEFNAIEGKFFLCDDYFTLEFKHEEDLLAFKLKFGL